MEDTQDSGGGGTQINVKIWIGDRPTRLRAEEVAETGRKISSGGYCGWRVRYTVFTTSFIDNLFPLLSHCCVTLRRKIGSQRRAGIPHVVPHACFHCDFLLTDQFLAPSHIVTFFFFPQPGQSHTSHAHVLMRSTYQLQCVFECLLMPLRGMNSR